MVAIRIEAAHAPDTLDVPLALARNLRLAQSDGISFKESWGEGLTFQEIGLDWAQANCLWGFVEFDTTQQTAEFETLLQLGCTCTVQSDGIACLEFAGKDLRFTSRNRWSLGLVGYRQHQTRQHLDWSFHDTSEAVYKPIHFSRPTFNDLPPWTAARRVRTQPEWRRPGS